jgi:two-component system sensor histidine kinase/response regulator
MTKNSKKKVLVVDDHKINQELMREMLERLDCQVEMASNGLVALDNLSTKDYDIIFMDLYMPEMDGFDTAKEIRNREQGKPSVPIIALTASDIPISKCTEAGMDACVSKPFEINDIKAILKKYLP